MTILFDLTTVVTEEKRRMFCYCQVKVHIRYFLSKVLTHPNSDSFYFHLGGLIQK